MQYCFNCFWVVVWGFNQKLHLHDSVTMLCFCDIYLVMSLLILFGNVHPLSEVAITYFKFMICAYDSASFSYGLRHILCMGNVCDGFWKYYLCIVSSNIFSMCIILLSIAFHIDLWKMKLKRSEEMTVIHSLYCKLLKKYIEYNT